MVDRRMLQELQICVVAPQGCASAAHAATLDEGQLFTAPHALMHF
jgi:hypothetical protein